MKGSLLSAAALSLAVGEVSAHYIFQQLSVNGVSNPTWKYIRQHTNYNSPVTDLNSNDLRCNVGATTGGNTETVTVAAGSSFTFKLDTPVYHQGPVSVYMSKAPGAAKDYDGSGGWFKILDLGPSFNGGSASWPMSGEFKFFRLLSNYLSITWLETNQPLVATQIPTPSTSRRAFPAASTFSASSSSASTTPGPAESPSST